MSLVLYAHPFSSYCQKALIALYENDVPFEFRMLDGEHPEAFAELTAIWPLGKFPVLVDGGRPVIEASVIIEHLQAFHPGPVKLIPDDPREALEVRFMDRVFDNYVMNVQQKLVEDALRPSGAVRDPLGVAKARGALETIYAWLDARMQGRPWAAGERFSLADCAAGPSLFYADWSHPIDEAFAALKAYRARLNARPSFARAIEAGRPYRAFFPLGAPDRD
ncbi:MAG: glutathione S-transferase family protein [Phenylobacterium sp.]|uniref:glutathione S-transferase family protein n=1 Tax=Phenylobacterium sp. TaxID=1871053 RepID=UPI00391ADEBA